MRLLITGASGSGTTTLGKFIAAKTSWNFIDADDYYWLPTNPPYQEKRDHWKRINLIQDELNVSSNCVLAGSIMQWGAILEDSFDLIVFLYLPPSIRVKRLKKREQKEFGYADPEFLKWASEYDTGPDQGRSLKRHEKWLAERKCEILRIDRDLTVQQRSELVFAVLSQSKDPKIQAALM